MVILKAIGFIQKVANVVRQKDCSRRKNAIKRDKGELAQRLASVSIL
jgi:hypothetical protein